MTKGIAARLAVVASVGLMSSLVASCGDGSGSTALSGTPASTATVGQAYSFRPRVLNIRKGAPTKFSIVNKPSWAGFNTNNGQLSGTPTTTGVFKSIQISLESGTAQASLPDFSITVTDPQAPTLGANTVTISWQAPSDNTDGSTLTNLSGYKIYYGGSSGEYSSSIDVPNPGLTSYLVQNLPAGQYYFTVTSYTSAGVESGFSPEVSATLD
jgi:hypothetical protein